MISKGLVTVLAVAVLAQASSGLPAPQWLTFKDGKFGVNFGGYHAEAGLGGLLTGNTAHGGLSASAGTPHGQQAGAGLGGLLGGNDRSAGGAYAGATAGNGVGASAAFGGGLDNAGGAGGLGAEAHAAGISKKVVKIGQTNGAAPPSETLLVHEVHAVPQAIHTRFNNDEFDSKTKTKIVLKEVQTDLQAPPVDQSPFHHTHTKTVYKKKVITHPHKVAVVEGYYDHGAQGGTVSNNVDLNRFFDFQAFTNIGASYSHPAPPAPSSTSQAAQEHHHDSKIHKEVHLNTRYDSNGHSGGSSHTSVGAIQNSNFWNDIFNIPISTLSAVNQFLNNKSGSGNIHVNKHTELH